MELENIEEIQVVTIQSEIVITQAELCKALLWLSRRDKKSSGKLPPAVIENLSAARLEAVNHNRLSKSVIFVFENQVTIDCNRQVKSVRAREEDDDDDETAEEY